MAHDHSFAQSIEHWAEGYAIDTILVSPVLFVLIWWGAFTYLPQEAAYAIQVFGQLSVIWLPFLLIYVFWDQWVKYVWSVFLTNQEYTVLEIRLPQQLQKSPMAMELFLATFYQTGRETTFIDRMWLGKVRLHFSLEIASFEGDVRFYIRIPTLLKRLTEARLYAQYPEVEIHDVPDYTREVIYDEKTMNLWGVEYKLSNPDPYPIKTYVDFGLDKDPKEEFKIDPISHVLEFLGSMEKNEYLWIQIILRAHRPNQRLGVKYGRDDFKEQVKEEIEKILAKVPVAEGMKATFHQLSERDKERLAALQRKESKPLFDVGMRAIYFAKKENYHGGNTSPGLHPLFRHLQTSDLNVIQNTRGMGKFDWFWQDPFGIRKPAERHHLFKHFQQRAYFWVPYSQDSFVLNTEELATLYHFPGESVKTPTMQRISSRKSGAPANLPTG